jgi:predicted phage-related endonuclease
MTDHPLVTVDIPPLTDVEFSEIRRRGIGGSDVSAILNLDPWRGAHSVWLQKMNREKYEQSEAALWGVLIEPLVLAEYAKREHVELGQLAQTPDTPYEITNPKRPRFLQHKTEKWMRATVDAVVAGASVGVDAKTKLDPHWSRGEYGEPNTDAVPRPVILQCQWYCGITGFPRWDVPVLFGNELRIYRVFFNQRLWEILVDRCGDFWRRYVLTRTPPPLEDSGVARKVVESVFPRNLVEVREATDLEGQIVNLYRQADERYKTLGAIREKIQATLCARIATADGLTGEFGKLLWKRSKPSTVIDWEKVAWGIATATGIDPKEFEKLRSQHTTMREGKRTFRTYWTEPKIESEPTKSVAIAAPSRGEPNGM